MNTREIWWSFKIAVEDCWLWCPALPKRKLPTTKQALCVTIVKECWCCHQFIDNEGCRKLNWEKTDWRFTWRPGGTRPIFSRKRLISVAVTHERSRETSFHLWALNCITTKITITGDFFTLDKKRRVHLALCNTTTEFASRNKWNMTAKQLRPQVRKDHPSLKMAAAPQ